MWEMDDSWNYTKNVGNIYKSNQEKYYKAEKDFNIDLNGDGIIGLKLKTIESTGNDELLKDAFNGFHVKDEDGVIHEIFRKGKKVKSNKTWELKAAETILGKNLVIDQNKKNKNFYMWEMDDSWNFSRNFASIYRTDQERYYEVEKILGMDLNNDKIIGLKNKKLKTINGVDHIAAKNLKNQSIHLLATDKNWSIENLSAKANNLKDGEDLFFKVEKDFHIDFNYDGFYGNPVI